jgi:hypothetical protein
MALGTVVPNTSKSTLGGEPVYHDYLVIPGDATYTAGGTTGFDAVVAAALGDDREVIAVIGQDCEGYVLGYLPANGGTLSMYEAGADGAALDEVADGDYHATNLNMLVISK